MSRATPIGETPSCAHEGCGCPPSAAHHPYCSAYCANVDRHEPAEGEGACACEHAACTASQEVAPSGNHTRTSVGRP